MTRLINTNKQQKLVCSEAHVFVAKEHTKDQIAGTRNGGTYNGCCTMKSWRSQDNPKNNCCYPTDGSDCDSMSFNRLSSKYAGGNFDNIGDVWVYTAQGRFENSKLVGGWNPTDRSKDFSYVGCYEEGGFYNCY